MALSDYKISDADYENKDIAALPVRPTISAAELQAAFDRLVKEVVVPKLNAMLDELASTVGADAVGKAVAGMGGQSVGALLEELAGTKAPIDNPGFTGTPTAPTPAASTNTAQLATTAFVQAALQQLVLEAGAADMVKAVYDPQSRAVDVFDYADEAAKHTVLTIALPVSGWELRSDGGYAQTVAAAGIETVGYSYIVSPAPESFAVYGLNGVYMGNSDTEDAAAFYAVTKPETDLTVSVMKIHTDEI